MAPPDESSREASASGSPTPPTGERVTVETETVPSVATLGVLASSANMNGTLRIKRSQDSVPRHTSRGVPATTSGTLSSMSASARKRSQRLAQGSKADIFAAKVANAVDEHDSSGSDETFVYDMPQAPVHVSEPIRKPFHRTASSAGSGVLSTDDDDDGVGINSNMGESAGISNGAIANSTGNYTPGVGISVSTGEIANPDTEVGPTSPKRLDPPRSPRTFVVPNRNRRTVSSTLIPTHELPDQEQVSYPANVSPFLELENPLNYESGVNGGWHSRHNSRSRFIEKGSPIKDPNDSIRAKHTYLQRWRTPAHTSDLGAASSESNERTSLLKARPSLYNYQSSRGSRSLRSSSQLGLPYGGSQQNGSIQYGSVQNSGSVQKIQNHQRSSSTHEPLNIPDEPIDPQLYTQTSTPMRLVLISSLVLVMLLFVIFVIGGFITIKRPLQDFDIVSLSDVFVSDKELVFSLIARARNPGLLAITINDCELDIFATSVHTRKNEQTPRTVMLGDINSLESPITFHGGLSSATQWHASTVKLVNPLGNDTALWSAISADEFDLTVKGVISYDIFWSENKEAVSRAYHVVSPALSML